MLILSLFPGIDLLGRAFEQEGYCIVRGPDLIFGGDIRDFHPTPNKFDGVIAGSPCQDFSKARRTPPTGYGIEMLQHFARCVTEARPEWFLLENVPTVPNIHIENYAIQRLDLNARECGSKQNRLRHFQYGSVNARALVCVRTVTEGRGERTALATEASKTNRRTFADFCELQGLPRDFDLPGWSRTFKYRAVGNGVPIQMGRVLARAIREALARTESIAVCACGCGRRITGKQISATPACRKRNERRRKCDSPGV